MREERLRPALKALRPHQWSKNVLIFVPMILTQEFFNFGMLFWTCLAFISFSFAASSVYVLNDLLDLSADRRHKTKRHRPFASGTLAIPTGLSMAAGLLATSLAICLVLPAAYFLVLCAYMVMTTAYSFFLKRMLLIDVLTLAGLYTVRIIAGSAASDVSTSFWLLAFSLFFFLSLALVKRYTELQDFGTGAGRATTGRGYVDADLETLGQAGMASGFASVMVLALYIDSTEVQLQYTEPYLVWPLCPVMLYIVVRIWILARRNQMHEDPVVFLLNDWRSQLMIRHRRRHVPARGICLTLPFKAGVGDGSSIAGASRPMALDLRSRSAGDRPVPPADTLLPFGNGRSYGDSCHNDTGTLIDSRPGRTIQHFDPVNGLLTADAGTLLCDITRHVAPFGWFLPVSPGTPVRHAGRSDRQRHPRQEPSPAEARSAVGSRASI